MGTLTKSWNDGSGDVLTVQYSGTGDGTVAVSSDPNAGASARELTLTIAAANGPTRTVTVRQFAATAYKPLTFDILTAGTITWSHQGTGDGLTIEYRKNGSAWTSITGTAEGVEVAVAVGDVLEFRGDNAAYVVKEDGTVVSLHKLGGTASFNASGHLCSLIGGGNSITADDAFRSLLGGSNIVSAQDLILADNVTPYCYYALFSGCASLTATPVLPAMTLAAYCYGLMFNNCSSLVTAPALPATTLATNCYMQMFGNCTVLTPAPELPATTLEVGCYYSMFLACKALVSAPLLPATTLVSDCYFQMFAKCSKLNYVKAKCATKPSQTYSKNWLNGVKSTGTFEKTGSWSASRDVHCVPRGWSLKTVSS